MDLTDIKAGTCTPGAAPVLGMGRIALPVAILALTLVVSCLTAGSAAAQSLTLDLAGGQSSTRTVLQLFALTTLLALAPSIAVTVTSFTRIIVVLSLVRSALGLQQTPPNIVLTSLAVFLSIFIMGKTWDKALTDGVTPYMAGTATEAEALKGATEPFRQFMVRNVRGSELELMASIAKRSDPNLRITADEVPWRVLVPAFMLSELRVAFEMGFIIFLPFMIIDIVVSSVLMAMGMMMMPPSLIALPLKLIFFVFADGWALLAGSLLQSYRL